jgi:FMN phosphatase YigB (HAD superfamily)
MVMGGSFQRARMADFACARQEVARRQAFGLPRIGPAWLNTPMLPQFIYFDMGNVLLRFSHARAAEQMARVAGVPVERMWQVVFEEGLEAKYERGDLTRAEFYNRVCEAVGARPGTGAIDIDALDHAGNDIFELNVPIVALVGHLFANGFRLGVFSNTSASHWQHCTGKFAILSAVFCVHALSYRLRAMKPEPAAYAAAARLAATPPERIFFTDDREENVAAARLAGWDAVRYESVVQLHEQLRRRGLIMNY